jgi:hypothetical protein
VYSLHVELGPSFMNCEFSNRYNLRERHSLSSGQRQCTLFGKNSRMSETGQCPLRNTVSLIAGHQNKEVYATCHGFRNANYSRSRARDFLSLHKTTRDLSNRLTKCVKFGSFTDKDFQFYALCCLPCCWPV